ncbi:hypothetical protein VaNZ11_012765, partial [Volvox africanus]
MPSTNGMISTLDGSVSDVLGGVGDLATSPAQNVARKPRRSRLTEILFGLKSMKLNTFVRRQSSSLDMCVTSERYRRPDAVGPAVSTSVTNSIAQSRRSESRIFSFLGSRLNDCTSQSSSQPHMLDSRQSSPVNKPGSQLQSLPEPPGPPLLLSSAASGGESPLRTAPNLSATASSSCAAVEPSPLPCRFDSALIRILDPSGAPEDLNPYPRPYGDPEPWYDNDIVLSVAYNRLAAKDIACNVQSKQITHNFNNSS